MITYKLLMNPIYHTPYVVSTERCAVRRIKTLHIYTSISFRVNICLMSRHEAASSLWPVCSSLVWFLSALVLSLTFTLCFSSSPVCSNNDLRFPRILIMLKWSAMTERDCVIPFFYHDWIILIFIAVIWIISVFFWNWQRHRKNTYIYMFLFSSVDPSCRLIILHTS